MLESLYITYSYFCFFNATATTEIYTYGHTRSLHDALPISTMSASDRKILTDMSAPAPANSASPRIPSATNPSTAFAPSNAPLPTSMKNWITPARSEEHTSELQSLMRISYAVFCLKKQKNTQV